jgi:hypothetical protein
VNVTQDLSLITLISNASLVVKLVLGLLLAMLAIAQRRRDHQHQVPEAARPRAASSDAVGC